MLGNDKNNNNDARYWNNPYIDGNDIETKAQITVYPFNKIGFVKQKVSLNLLSSINFIPKLFKGLKTDVVETGEFTSLSLTNKVRPVTGGLVFATLFIL